MVLMGYTVKGLCDEMGMEESTFYRKIKADGAFTRDEMNRLIDILKFPNPMAVFFAQELAETQERR
jgi:predicted DNA-binding transcriptional regulator AlpA